MLIGRNVPFEQSFHWMIFAILGQYTFNTFQNFALQIYESTESPIIDTSRIICSITMHAFHVYGFACT